ncbi:Uncharacterised protein [BD1-7 clade bacterium]|uniref:Spondin domain-containing protein n=1 Tax=BD1-7 clade bacterium TaxID=2029982 RepID=A0A5S9Q6A4_9GAMM|nr:Uncharacterised protein [BD1-7 clade bacterium]CAA0112758.1 Uncharacterised protein [BD1-7 clade bacterium]
MNPRLGKRTLMCAGILTATLTPLLSACSGDSNPAVTPEAETGTPALDTTSESARYRLRFIGEWDTTRFGSRPGGAHFTGLIGSTVNTQASLWRSGELASAGFENVAELGANSNFRNEIRAAMDANQAGVLIEASDISAEGVATLEFAISRTYPRVTLASMVAPSPDWFVGVNQLSLLDTNGEWQLTLALPVYDAGTEGGAVFSLSNPATVPAMPIALLIGTVADQTEFKNGLVGGRAIASFEFERIE